MSQRQALIDYTLHLADDALILGHRNSQWTGHGPILEQDIALSNIALDLIGQARNFYQYAAKLLQEEEAEVVRQGISDDPEMAVAGALQTGNANLMKPVTEDSLAYLRDSWDFKNCLLVEQDNGDWGKTILRQFFFSSYQYCLYAHLQGSRDAQLAAIAEKSYKEVSYHLRWSSEWVIRLGDGTPESHQRMERALDDLWKYTGELFLPSAYEKQLTAGGIAPDLSLLRPMWEERLRAVMEGAALGLPGAAGAGGRGEGGRAEGGRIEGGPVKGGRADGGRIEEGPADGGNAKGIRMLTGGKEGRHTEQLGYLLAEMQFLQRAYPGCQW